MTEQERLSDKSLENAIKIYKSVVEEYRGVKNTGYSTVLDETAIGFLEELQQYRAIGTVEQCKEAVDKAQEIPLDPLKEGMFDYKGICPVCGNRILQIEKYCSQCGKKVID